MRLRARWILPISSPPIDDGWVAIEGGRIVGIGEGLGGAEHGAEHDLGRVALMPGLVNAHTHLELSYLAGAVPASARFTDWIRRVMALRRDQPEPAAPVIIESARRAIAAMHAAGVAAVGDVSNTLVTVPLLNEAPVAAAVFFEILRFKAADAEIVLRDAAERLATATPSSHVRVWLAPHAPYSVSPRLFEAIRTWHEGRPGSRTSVHLGESPQELELLARGTGPFRDLLQDLGAWDDGWETPRCGPVEYLARIGLLGPRTLVVHGTQLTSVDLDELAAAGATLVTCPRSNRHVGAGDPPVGRFYAAGLPIAIGTDSLASAPSLDVFGELPVLRALAPDVPAARLLASATLAGARALGCDARLGSLDAGKDAAVLAVTVPPGVDAIEEYLVGGIDPGQVRWAAAAGALRSFSWN